MASPRKESKASSGQAALAVLLQEAQEEASQSKAVVGES
jgi:hypothetical protein